MTSINCPTEADTRAVGRRLASLCRPGDVIVLAGRLGAGKTAFTAGLAEGLGIDEPVMSPSFVMMRRYDSGFLPLVHADVYRISSIGEFDDLDVLDEGIDGVVVIEWGQVVTSELPADLLRVEFVVADDDARLLTFHSQGHWSARPLHELTS